MFDEKKELEFNNPSEIESKRKEMDFDANKKPIESKPEKVVPPTMRVSEVRKQNPNFDKEQLPSKAEMDKMAKLEQPKFTSKDYGNVRVYPNKTGSNMDKDNKWIGKHYSLMEAHNLNDDYLKKNHVGKTKAGADVYKMPDGYLAGNPRINSASFKTMQDLEDFEKKSGEHTAAMKEGTYLDDYIKNYKEPKLDPKDEDSIWETYNRGEIDEPERNRLLSERTKKITEEKPQQPRFVNQPSNDLLNASFDDVFTKNDINKIKEYAERYEYDLDEFEYELFQDVEDRVKNKGQSLTNAKNDAMEEYLERMVANAVKNPKVQFSDLTDDELKEELYDNEYWYGSAKNADEVAKRLVDRTKISPERAKEFASKYWKGADTWSTNKPKEPKEVEFSDDEINKRLTDFISEVDNSGQLREYDVDEITDLLWDKKVDFPYSRNDVKKALESYMQKSNQNDKLFSRMREEKINLPLLKSKLDNYNKIGDVRAIVDGDVGNFNRLSNGEIMDLLDAYGYDYNVQKNPEGHKTIIYIPKRK